LRESFNRYENIKKELDEIKNPTVPEHQEQINLSNNKNNEIKKLKPVQIPKQSINFDIDM
jgi:hypothetical protein